LWCSNACQDIADYLFFQLMIYFGQWCMEMTIEKEEVLDVLAIVG
jgi:hypothetical protein